MMFAVASVKRAETAFPGLHGAVEVVTRGRHVEQLRARKRRTHLIIRLGGILSNEGVLGSNEGVLGYDEGVWNDEGNRQRLLDMLKAHAAELRAWASDAGVRLPSAESAGELREQVRDLPQEPQIQEQPGYGYQPGFQQPQQWQQQQPWN